MVIRAEQCVKELREQMRGGEGTAEILHILPDHAKPQKCRLMARITLPVGASIGGHDHIGEAEVFYILQGTASADDNGQEVALHAGDTLVTQNAAHSIKNAGDEPLSFMAVIVLD